MLATSDEDEVGSQINTNDIFKKTEKRFQINEVNCRDYHREVRRILYAKMDTSRKLTGLYYHSFCRWFERAGGVHSKMAKPDYDAWCLVIGKKRSCFDAEKFFKLYNDARSQIAYIRTLLNIQVSENF